jgi:hypothetical protein
VTVQQASTTPWQTARAVQTSRQSAQPTQADESSTQRNRHRTPGSSESGPGIYKQAVFGFHHLRTSSGLAQEHHTELCSLCSRMGVAPIRTCLCGGRRKRPGGLMDTIRGRRVMCRGESTSVPLSSPTADQQPVRTSSWQCCQPQHV